MAVAVAVHEIQLVGSDRLPTFSKFFRGLLMKNDIVGSCGTYRNE